jgi:hypothetical protein
VLAACGSPYYTSDPIEAWVVDADTGKPIEGAIVVAHWQLRGATLDSGTRRNQLEVIETVTDRNGRFFIPGFTKINFTLEQLREEDPRVVIFKPGFSIAGGHNSYPIGGPSPGAHRSSPLRGRRLEVKSLSGDMERYLRELSLVSATLSDLAASGDLRSVPKLIHAMVCEKRRLKSVSSLKFLLSVPGETGVEADCEVK